MNSKYLQLLTYYGLLWLQAVTAKDDQICLTGYIMDKFCIDRGTLLDAPSVKTLEDPGRHSVHCLIDISQCVNSGFEILLDPPSDDDPDHACYNNTDEDGTILYNRAFSLDSVGNDEVVRVAAEVGDCSTCTGSGTLRKGFRATVIGTVQPNTGSDSEPPTLAVTSLVDASSAAVEDDLCGDVPKANITSCLVSTSTMTNPIYVHGTLMLISWGLLIPAGVIWARWSHHDANGAWLKVHQTIQALGLLGAVIGWVVALVNFDVFSGGDDFVRGTSYYHGIAGMCVMVLGLLQPINALLRPHLPNIGEEKTTKRFVWEIFHRSTGWVAVLLACGTIVSGTFLLPFKKDQTLIRIFYGVLLLLLVALMVWIQRSRKKSKAQESNLGGGEEESNVL